MSYKLSNCALVVFDDIRISNEMEKGMRKGEGERVYLRRFYTVYFK